MNNIRKIYDITDKIRKVYSKLFYLDKNNKKMDEEYNFLLEALQELLKKEDQLYQNLTSKDIMVFLAQLESKIEKNKDKVYKNSYVFDKAVENYDLIVDRIRMRFSVHVELVNLGDNAWYQNLYKGIYLTNNTDVRKEKDFYYYFIYSSWSIINYIKNATSNYYQSRYLFLDKYINSFINPFLESVLVKNNFKMDYNYDFILNLNSYNNQFTTYMDAAYVFYEIKLKNFVQDILYGKFEKIDTHFSDLLIRISSFLELISEDMREQLYMECVDIYRMAKTRTNICAEQLFELFNNENYKKENKKYLSKK